MKKGFSFILALILLLSVSLQAVFAEGYGSFSVEDSPKASVTGPQSQNILAQKLDVDEFTDYLFKHLYSCSESIDISKFKLEPTKENMNAIGGLIYDIIIEAFHVGTISFTYSDHIISVNPQYLVSAGEYHSRLKQCEARANEILAGIIGNDRLGDKEKALLIHDRIALSCEYDHKNYINNTVPRESYTLYGVLALGVAVCQGYAETYMYLLEKVGIASTVCESDALNHAWNIVYIDGVPYHVDVTWDDPSNGWDVAGRVLHNNFLLSTSALYNGVNGSSAHDATDYDSTPTDKRYDNYFWQDSKTAFQLIGNEIYYIDSATGNLCKYSDRSTVLNIPDTWKASASSMWLGNFSKLISVGNVLIYNTPTKVIRYVPSSNRSSELFSIKSNNYNYIYGLNYDHRNEQIIYDVNVSPNFTEAGAARKYNGYVYHSGGAATCSSKAVCEYCGLPYGSVGSHSFVEKADDAYLVREGDCVTPSVYKMSCMVCGTTADGMVFSVLDERKHIGDTELRGFVEASESADGYSGDLYCLTCNKVMTKGHIIPAQAQVIVRSDVFEITSSEIFIPRGTTVADVFAFTDCEYSHYIDGVSLGFEDLMPSGGYFVISTGKYYGYCLDIILRGDVDCNAKINVKDVMALLKYSAGWYDENAVSFSLKSGDVNRDGKINIKDSMYILKFIAGWSGYEL